MLCHNKTCCKKKESEKMATNLVLFGIVIGCLAIAIVLSIVASSKAKNHQDDEASDYSIAATVFIGLAFIGMGVALYFTVFSSSPPTDINSLVAQTTSALNKHVSIINENTGIINNALSKMGGVSKDLCNTFKNTQCV